MNFPRKEIREFNEAANRSFWHLIDAMDGEKALWTLRDKLASWPQPKTEEGADNIEYIMATAFNGGTKYLNTNGELRSSKELGGYKASASGERNGYRFFFLLYENEVLVVAIAVEDVMLLAEDSEEVSAVLAAADRVAEVGVSGKGS